MNSTESPNGEAPPVTTANAPKSSSRPINHRLVSLAFRPPLSGNGNGAEKKAVSTPVLFERLEENDLRLSVHVKLNGRTESLADITLERMVPEGKMEKNRWVLLKALEDLIASACQGA